MSPLPPPPRPWRFALVAASGVAVNYAVLALLAGAGVHSRAASAGGIAASVLTTFVLREVAVSGRTWRDRSGEPHAGPLLRHALEAFGSGLVQWGIVVGILSLGLLTPMLGGRALYGAQLIAAGGGLVALAKAWRSGSGPGAPDAATPPAAPGASGGVDTPRVPDLARAPALALLAGLLALVCAVNAVHLDRHPMPPPSSHRTWLVAPRMAQFFLGYDHRRTDVREAPQLAMAAAYYTLPTRVPIEWTHPTALLGELSEGGRLHQLVGPCTVSYSTCLPHAYAAIGAVAALFPGHGLLAALVPTFYYLMLLAALYGIGVELSGRAAGLTAAAVAAGYPGLFGMSRWPEGYIVTSALSTAMVWCLLKSRGLTRWGWLLPFCVMAFTAIRTGEGFSEAAGAGLAVGGPFVLALLAGLAGDLRVRRLPWRTLVGLAVVGALLGATTDWAWVHGSLFQVGQGVDEEAMAAQLADPNAGPLAQAFIRHGLYLYFLANDYVLPPLLAWLLLALPFAFRRRNPGRATLATWFLIAFVGYSLMLRKAVWYPIPMLPPLAAITGIGLAALPWPRMRTVALALAALMGVHQLVTLTFPESGLGLPRPLTRPYPPGMVKVRWVDLAERGTPQTDALTADARALLHWIDAEVPPSDTLTYIGAVTPWGQDPLAAVRLGWYVTLHRPDVVVVELAMHRYLEGHPYEGLSPDRFSMLVCIGGSGHFTDCEGALAGGPGWQRDGEPPPRAFTQMTASLLSRSQGAISGLPPVLLLGDAGR